MTVSYALLCTIRRALSSHVSRHALLSAVLSACPLHTAQALPATSPYDVPGATATASAASHLTQTIQPSSASRASAANALSSMSPPPADIHARVGTTQSFTGPSATTAQLAIQDNDRLLNARSNVFGAQLFTGAFSHNVSPGFNPSYIVAIGDQLRLRMWGGFQYDAIVEVDPQGNVFLPHAGPLHVAGVQNDALQAHIGRALRRVFTQRVEVYAALEAARPVRVYVSGFVRRPGMYDGTSNDSLLRYLDKAGGIDPDRGSFLDVRVKRGVQTRAHINLYPFLLEGELPSVPLQDGDVIFVGPRQSTILVGGVMDGNVRAEAASQPPHIARSGDTRCAAHGTSSRRFEFTGATTTLAAIAAAARPAAAATHARITRNGETLRNVGYLPLSEGLVQRDGLVLHNGDEVTFTSDKRPGTITVRVAGEHNGTQEFVLPYGSRLGALLALVTMTSRSATEDIQLFRDSVRGRQKTLLDTQLRNLEAAVLTARSGTKEEAELRKEEADLVLRWVERARKIEPLGQVVIGQGEIRDDLLLENGDLIRVPARDGLVLVGGEVLFPNTVAARPNMTVQDYIAQTGGFTQSANSSRIVVAHRDGTFSDGTKHSAVREGDEVIVLPRVQFKTRQFAKDLFQILFQLAVAAKIAVGLG